MRHTCKGRAVDRALDARVERLKSGHKSIARKFLGRTHHRPTYIQILRGTWCNFERSNKNDTILVARYVIRDRLGCWNASALSSAVNFGRHKLE
jgi:hypothetical protein